MSASAITVKNLGDEKIENAIREQLELKLKDHPGFRVSAMGSDATDTWEIKVQKPPEQKPWVVVLTMTVNQTVGKAVQHVMDGIASFG
ncbi:MAG TPA: hypothetical protein VGF82_25995 [Terracidiphilus sp.]|jgi:hypothetical protein